MKRVVKRVLGYTIVIGLLLSLLVLELCFIAMAVVSIIGIIAFAHLGLNIWTATEAILFGLMALLGAIGAVLFPYHVVKGWMSTARQSPGKAA